MPDRPRPVLGLLVALAVALLAGCGGSSAPRDTSSGESPSAARAARASFVAHAEAICRTLSAQEQPLKARQESLKRLPSAAVADTEFVALVRQLVALSRTADGKLRALARPAGDAQNIGRLLTSFSQQLTEVTDVANAAAKQESAVGEAAVLELRRSIAQNIALAGRYGMKACLSSE
jgi:hypothetical protein